MNVILNDSGLANMHFDGHSDEYIYIISVENWIWSNPLLIFALHVCVIPPVGHVF